MDTTKALFVKVHANPPNLYATTTLGPLRDLMNPKFGSKAVLLSQSDHKPFAVHVCKAHPYFRIRFSSETFVVPAACLLGKLLNPLHSRHDLEASMHRGPNVDL